MKTVMVFDDRPQVRKDIIESLSEVGLKALSCKDVYEADECWSRYQNEIDIVIFDIMMSPIGLPEDLRAQTKQGLLTGWVWLWRAINGEGVKEQEKTSKGIVLFSGYIDDMLIYINSDQPSADEKEFAKTLALIPKGKNRSIESLLTKVKELTNDKK